MIHRAVALMSLAVACTSADGSRNDAAALAQRDSAIFAIELWPGEGVPVLGAVRAQLILRRSPDVTAPVSDTLTVQPDAVVQYDSTLVVTLRPGVFRVRDSTRVTGRNLGEIRNLTADTYYSPAFRTETVSVSLRDTVEYLQYRAEGTCFVRIGKRVIDADPCPENDTTALSLEREPSAQWWVRVAGKHGHGWIMVSDTTLKLMRREF